MIVPKSPTYAVDGNARLFAKRQKGHGLLKLDQMGSSPWSQVFARVDDSFWDFTLSAEFYEFLHT
jgi:hypothetical protein